MPTRQLFGDDTYVTRTPIGSRQQQVESLFAAATVERVDVDIQHAERRQGRVGRVLQLRGREQEFVQQVGQEFVSLRRLIDALARQQGVGEGQVSRQHLHVQIVRVLQEAQLLLEKLGRIDAILRLGAQRQRTQQTAQQFEVLLALEQEFVRGAAYGTRHVPHWQLRTEQRRYEERFGVCDHCTGGCG